VFEVFSYDDSIINVIRDYMLIYMLILMHNNEEF